MENGKRKMENTFGSPSFSVFRFPFSILFAVIILASLSSCDDPVDLKLNTASPYLIVDGTLDNDPSRVDTIRLKTSVGYLENQPFPRAQGAEIIVTGTDGQIDTLQEVVPGKYITRSFVGSPLNTYTVNIAWQGQRYRAAARMPRAVGIDSVRALYVVDDPFEDPGYLIYLYTLEPKGVGDFYQFELRKNDTLQNRAMDLIFVDDAFVDGNYITDFSLNREPYKRGDKVIAYAKCITEDAYYFYVELQTTFFQGGLFSAPPSNVRTNVFNLDGASTKRATGYLFVTALAQDSVVCE